MNPNFMSFTRCAFFLFFGWVAACTGDVEPLTPAQRQAVSAYVSKVPPSPEHALDIDFDGKVKLLGYDLGREQWRPGQTMRVTWHWQVVEPLGDGWKLFTHIDDVDNDRSLNQDGNGSVRWLYGPEHWRAGTYIRDPQELDLPEDWGGSFARIYVGFWRADERLRVSRGAADATDERAAPLPRPSRRPLLKMRSAVMMPCPGSLSLRRNGRRGSTARSAMPSGVSPTRLARSWKHVTAGWRRCRHPPSSFGTRAIYTLASKCAMRSFARATPSAMLTCGSRTASS